MTFEEALADYQGMNYEQASREGLRILKRATDTGNWHELPERLAALRSIMKAESHART